MHQPGGDVSLQNTRACRGFRSGMCDDFLLGVLLWRRCHDDTTGMIHASRQTGQASATLTV